MIQPTEVHINRVLATLALSVALLVTGACGSDSDDAASATSDGGESAEQHSEGRAADEPGDEPADPALEEDPKQASAATGSATVVHDGTTYEFIVIQCIRDRQSVDQTVVEFQADGVPAETPQALVDEIMAASATDPDLDITSLLEPVYEYGPTLGVSRLEDGGDFVALFQPPEIIQSDTADFRDPSGRFLDLAADFSTVSASTLSVEGGTIEVQLTCP